MARIKCIFETKLNSLCFYIFSIIGWHKKYTCLALLVVVYISSRRRYRPYATLNDKHISPNMDASEVSQECYKYFSITILFP